MRGRAYAVRLLTDTYVCAWVRAASSSGLMHIFLSKTIFDEMPELVQMEKQFKKSNCISLFVRSTTKEWDRWTEIGSFKPGKTWNIPNTVGWHFDDKKPRLLRFSETLGVIGKTLVSKKQAKEFPAFVVMDMDDVARYATLLLEDEFPLEIGLTYAF